MADATTTLETALRQTFGDIHVPDTVQFAARGEFADHLRSRGWDDTALRSQYREGTMIRYTTTETGRR